MLYVSSLELPVGDGQALAATVFAPEVDQWNGALLLALPGGGMSRQYFDLGGEEESDYSFGRQLAQSGSLVVSLDFLGVGNSSRPADSYTIDGDDLVDSCDHALQEILCRLTAGTLVPDFRKQNPLLIGAAHSMGALIMGLWQAKKQRFNGLMMIGFATSGLPELMTDRERSVAGDRARLLQQLPQLARTRFNDQQYPNVHGQRDQQNTATRILKQAADVLLPIPAVWSMMPGNIAPEIAQIDCPILLIVGDNDMTGPPHDLPREYVASRDVSLVIVPNCGHHPFVAEGRLAMFRRMVAWVREQISMREIPEEQI